MLGTSGHVVRKWCTVRYFLLTGPLLQNSLSLWRGVNEEPSFQQNHTTQNWTKLNHDHHTLHIAIQFMPDSSMLHCYTLNFSLASMESRFQHFIKSNQILQFIHHFSFQISGKKYGGQGHSFFNGVTQSGKTGFSESTFHRS